MATKSTKSAKRLSERVRRALVGLDLVSSLVRARGACLGWSPGLTQGEALHFRFDIARPGDGLFAFFVLFVANPSGDLRHV